MKKSILCIPEWSSSGFKEENGRRCNLFICTKCGETCEFLQKGDEELPTMRCKKNAETGLNNIKPQGEITAEEETFLSRIMKQRGVL